MIFKNLEKKDKTIVFKVEADGAEFEAAVNTAYQKNKGQINIPGFRKGKAPRKVIEGMYGAEVFYQDALDELAPNAFEFAVTSENIKFVGRPSISNVEVTDSRTAEFEFTVEAYPVPVLGQYKGISAERVSLTATDEDVDKEIDSIRRRNARMLTVDDRPAQMGDTANIDFDGYLDGERFDGGKAEGYSLELGSGSFVPGFEEQVVGMSCGDEKDIDITFPEDYVENLAGKAVVFKVKLNGITVPELPELDDEFAKDVSEFDTLVEYRTSVKEGIQKRYDDDSENQFRSEVMRKAVDNMTVEVPEVMVNDKIEDIVRSYAGNYGVTDRNIPLAQLAQMLGFDDDMLNSQIRPSAEFQVKNELLLESVIEAEKLEVSEADVEEYLNKIAESVGAKTEEIKQYFGMEFVKNEKLKEMANDVIFNSAVVSDASASAE